MTVPAVDLPRLPAGMEARGGDPALVGQELLHLISQHIDSHPRSAQVRIGPSELGTPCTRRVGYKLLNVEPTNPRSAAWKPTVGTAVHAWLEQAMQAHNDAHTIDRFYLEETVIVGEIADTPITGSADCYDRFTATVVDWKVVGLAALKRYKASGPGEQYRTQAHLYGRGFVNAGLPVDHVAVMFLPQNGELHDAHWWVEPYDESVALAALQRADGVAALTAQLGPAAIPLLPPTESFCTYCPWWLPASTDATSACPGAPMTSIGVLPMEPPAAPAA